jgi:hypothetical protein
MSDLIIWRAFVFLASMYLVSTELSAAATGGYSAGICEGAASQNQQASEVNFVRVDLQPRPDLGSDDAPAGEIVSFDPDVLLVGSRSALTHIALSGFDGRVESVVCIEYRPEMLALELRNGAGDVRNAGLIVRVTRGGADAVLFGRLPALEANQATRILLSASSSLADAEAISLQINLSNDSDYHQ